MSKNRSDFDMSKDFRYIYGGDSNAERYFPEIEETINKLLERNVIYKTRIKKDKTKHLFAKITPKELEKINASGMIGWLVFGYEL